ncbi:hypothetical protein J3F84DRAFT_404654 [Trichoderma pleuroticola]
MQRYASKLNPEQTAAVIKIAVTRPNARKNGIVKNVRHLQLPQDPYLRHYGVQLETSSSKTEARILAGAAALPMCEIARGFKGNLRHQYPPEVRRVLPHLSLQGHQPTMSDNVRYVSLAEWNALSTEQKVNTIYHSFLALTQENAGLRRRVAELESQQHQQHHHHCREAVFCL